MSEEDSLPHGWDDDRALANDESVHYINYKTVNDKETIFNNPYFVYSWTAFGIVLVLIIIAILCAHICHQIRKRMKLKKHELQIENIKNDDDNNDLENIQNDVEKQSLIYK
eukprot:325344_1